MSYLQHWQKSSYSADSPENACVELTHAPGASILLRESDDLQAVITTTPAALRALTRAAKAGRFDHLSR